MSSLKKYLPQKTYKERPQPKRRAKFGLLEKHKDYVERAQNYHKKERRYKALVEKALQRNPEEFYFKMINSKTDSGVHIGVADEKGGFLEEEGGLKASRLYSYVVSQINHERSRIQALQSELHFTEVPKRNKHIIFVDSDQEEPDDNLKIKEAATSSLSDFSSWAKRSVKKTEKALKRKYLELRFLLEREKKLRELLQILEVQKSAGKVKKSQLGKNSVDVHRGVVRRRERMR